MSRGGGGDTLFESWPETHVTGTGYWNPLPGPLIPSSFANIKDGWLFGGAVGEQVGWKEATHRQESNRFPHSVCFQQERGINTPDGCELTVFQ